MKTTVKQYNLFKKECRKWVKWWGLHMWEVLYSHEDLGKDCYAQVQTHDTNKASKITFNKHGQKGLTDYVIKLTAFHEVCELLVNPITAIEESPRMEKASHELIRTLENKIFNKDNK